jgi:hypothetical protein
MLRKRGSVACIGVLIFFLIIFSLMPAYSAPIRERDARLIEIAFMNGFIAALDLDEKTVAELRNDMELLRQYLVDRSKAYLDKVRHLNSDAKP